ncbi:MAG: OmpA family protein [Halieaceae bacterium]|jgi:OOP family OmpA-OmpF porin|nr:OmpA family protein [Halieaceae bacterium]
MPSSHAPLALLLAALLAVASTASAEGPPITFSAGGSYNIFDDDREVDDDSAYFGAIEFRFTERWATEFWYSDGEADGDNGFDVDTLRWHLDALYYLKPRGNLQPYLAAGGGQLEREWDVPNGNLDEVDNEANFGGGVHWYFTDNFSLRGDARYLFGFDDDTSDFTVSIGLSYRLGTPQPRRRAAEPEPAPEPEPEPEPLDSDGDGVLDEDDACPGTPAGRRVDARGCEPRFIAGESVQLKVNFGFDSANVDPNFLDDIQALADFMKRHPEVTTTIEAHTDSMGPEAYNLGLSQRRADSVIEVLTNRFGIAASRLTAEGFGESQPIESNDTEAGRAANRRVVASIATEGRME